MILAAQAFRLVIVPDLTRASAAGRLTAEFVSYASALLAIAVPATIGTVVFSRQFGDVLTGTLPPVAATVASRAIPWLVPAAFAQTLAALEPVLPALVSSSWPPPATRQGRWPA